MLVSLLPFELDVSELVFDVVFDWLEVLQVPGEFLDFVSQAVDFLRVDRLGFDKFVLLFTFFFHLFFEFGELCVKDFVDAFLEFFQFFFEIHMEIGSTVGQLMITFDLLLSNVKTIYEIFTFCQRKEFLKFLEEFFINLRFFVHDIFFTEVNLLED